MSATEQTAFALPEIVELDRQIDCSTELHRSISNRLFELAGLDPELAEAFYQLDFDPDAHPLYPDVPETLGAIKAMGVKTALVSDIHFDLRPEFEDRGIVELFDAFVLSFEHGFKKPDQRMFRTALKLLDVDATEALMVGDRATHDGGAASLGITTLILPPPAEFGPRGLDVVLRLLD